MAAGVEEGGKRPRSLIGRLGIWEDKSVRDAEDDPEIPLSLIKFAQSGDGPHLRATCVRAEQAWESGPVKREALLSFGSDIPT